MAAKKGKSTAKATAKKRTVNPTGGARPAKGVPFNEQDSKRRLGNFSTAGEHSLVGGRQGIIGQTSKKFTTDKPRKKK